ncbi:hypothetical protein LCGC14_1946380 [marine sediment metagenome]|uniref:Uncharacterized protein n=1 Tax=marine sediment metagenome TaxID=412755 RepID=A0A0F9FIT2_9ZZZZ
MKCPECGGSDLQGTCTCSYEYPPEQIVSHQISEEGERESILKDFKQICHFCGVDLFLYKTDSKILTCLSCATELDHDDCTECVRCNKTWLVGGNGSVCALCKIL